MELKYRNQIDTLLQLSLLLIVPYGIEIYIPKVASMAHYSLNRTLWN